MNLRNRNQRKCATHVKWVMNPGVTSYPGYINDYNSKETPIDCEKYYENKNSSSGWWLYEEGEHVLYSVLIPMVCAFGLLGNIVNVLVLIKRTARCLRESMERSAYMGLVALAVSDMAFCISIIPHSAVERHLELRLQPRVNIKQMYLVCHIAFINIFLTSSTWLTVYMALSRCLAICFPLKIRAMFTLSFTRIAILLIFIFSVLLNMPRFWAKTIIDVHCINGSTAYYIGAGPITVDLTSKKVYACVYFSLAILLPLLLMAVSNTFLIRELRESAARRREYTRSFRGKRPSGSRGGSGNIVTLMLVLIVIFYFLLVLPAEIMIFFQEVAFETCQTLQMYNLTLAVANGLQAINFSFNFVLYCALSPQCRQIVAEFFHFRSCGKQKLNSKERVPYGGVVVRIDNSQLTWIF